MKLETREDIHAPMDRVLSRITDADAFERALLRRGIDVLRDPEGPVEVGTAWHLKGQIQGRDREVTAHLMSKGPEGWTMECHSGGIVALIVVDLVALSQNRTRLFVGVDVRATSLASKVLLKSLALAKGGISRRFEERVRAFSEKVSS
jgi:hypothetical protein